MISRAAVVFLVSACAYAAVLEWGDKAPAPKSIRLVGTHPGDPGDSPNPKPGPGTELAAFSAGCFWGTEEAFRRVPGVTATSVGYMGRTRMFPNYQRAHAEGLAETVLVEFDPHRVSYPKLLTTFWTLRHSTLGGNKEAEARSPYRSSIWTFTDAQIHQAQESKHAQERREGRKFITRVQPAMPFYRAEEEHQQYVEKSGVEACR